ncbi:MAG: type II toxin-antitoxin system VapC family toxin [Bacillota bacterium]|nr:type II toxin-antitoxin system VapC family toxin [Bacillota bacterium]
MARATYCLDTSVLVKVLVPEEGSAEATALLRRIVSGGHRLVAPAFAWAEVGTVLRKKVKAGLLSESEADARWARFLSLSIDYLEDRRIQEITWEIAAKFTLAGMYDAAFLAVSEVSAEDRWNAVELWTADRELVQSLGQEPPEYVRLLYGS